MSTAISLKKSSKNCINKARQQFSPLGEITSRSQFGGYGLCCDNTMFALVVDGELYLRASGELALYFQMKKAEHFIYEKRGVPVPMKYYKVNEALWKENDSLLRLANEAVEGAKLDKENITRKRATRLKDLPNLGASLERLLWRVGITSVDKLKQQGSIRAYLMLSKIKTTLGYKILLALEGAIAGFHVAVLPESKKRELLIWWEENCGRNRNAHEMERG